VSSSRLAIAVLLAALAAGCAQVPTAEEYRSGAVVPVEAQPGVPVRDERGRFREIFCGVYERSGGAPGGCEPWLWRLADEPPARPQPAPLPPPPAFRTFVITGAFSDCFDEYALAYDSAVRVLAARGYAIELLPVSGRSSVEHNGRSIAEALASRGVQAGERIVLVGYSKGAIDALEFVAAHRAAARPVVAVVSVAGPMLGSPAAAAGQGFYALFANSFAKRCDPGDGGVLASLAPEARTRWFEQHTLPDDVAYFSLAALPTRDRLARGAAPSWRLLARQERWNDGQVAANGAAIPGGAVLGYPNADHWGVALNIEVSQPLLAHRKDSTPYPREQLLEAILLHVGERLDGQPR
jgi:hypothetical protein